MTHTRRFLVGINLLLYKIILCSHVLKYHHQTADVQVKVVDYKL